MFEKFLYASILEILPAFSKTLISHDILENCDVGIKYSHSNEDTSSTLVHFIRLIDLR
jgi:hypothetical protein